MNTTTVDPDLAARDPESPLATDAGLRGMFDRIELGRVCGWAARGSEPSQRVEIEVLADGIVVGLGVADTFRGDLLAAGIGDGKHAFWIELPHALWDGAPRRIEVRERATGAALAGSPRKLTGVAAESFELKLDGAALVGSARLPGHDGSPLQLLVMEGSEPVARGIGNAVAAAPEQVRFHIPLPAALFDGRPHAFTVRAEGAPWLVAQTALIMPAMLTPAEALQQHTREGLRPALANVPGLRYDALAAGLEALPRDGAPAALAAALDQLVHCHATLVRGADDAARGFRPLRFPRVDAPTVSVVIPVHNKFAVTYHCLASLLLAPNRASFEVVLVDDGSSDDSTRIPELIEGVACVRHDTAQGFIRACNAGGALARGEYIVMLNNDTEVTAGWLDELLWPFAHFDAVGMSGAKLLYPDGALQEAGGIVWNSGDPWNYGRRANPNDPRYNYTRQVDYVSGACIMLPTALWRELGGFDEAFVPAYFEDTDLAFRVRDRGLKTVYAPLAQVVHYEGVSSGTSTSSGTKRFQEINRPKFKKRWVGACRNNGRVGVDLELNKDRNVELRALVLDSETPQPDQNAGSYAAVQELRMLQALGFKCTFVPMNLAWLGHYTEDLQRMGVECVHAPYATGLKTLIEQRGSEFDLVYVTRYNVAEQCLDAIRQHAPQAKLVLNNADLHFLRELRAGIASGDRETINASVRTREKELAVMRKVDLVLSYTDVEKAVIQSHNLDSTLVARCPWVTDVVPQVPGHEGRADIAFLGSYKHHPNAEAVEWFVEQVMPLLREALPEARLRVYGSNPTERLRKLAERDARIVIDGWVPTVDAVYDHCRVFVAPLQSGAGIKGKVIGAMAHGVPCVLSPVAAEGIAVGNGVDACVAARPEEWVAAITALYRDPEAWAAMSRHALAFATRHYGFEQGVSAMQEALQTVGLATDTDHRALASR
ncbi:MAG TPA: glycosyltransferase [Methylibium sp.]|nr:glycosyltransferase [Methylibium sp.]